MGFRAVIPSLLENSGKLTIDLNAIRDSTSSFSNISNISVYFTALIRSLL